MHLLVLLVAAVYCVMGTPIMTAKQPDNFVHTAKVTVQWNGITPTTDTTSDWISVWWVPFQATYVEYVNITGSDTNGSASFNLLNARHPYYFRYYRNNNMLVQSNQVSPIGAYPHQLRLSLEGLDQQDAMRVTWTSNRTSVDTVVQYGTDPAALTGQVLATDTTYTHDELNRRVSPDTKIFVMTKAFPDIGSRALRCGHNCYQDNTTCLLFVDPGIFHSAVIDGLKTQTKYFYRVGERNGLMSEVFHFMSKPANTTSNQPEKVLSILYFADGGVGGNGDTPGSTQGGATNNDPPLNGGDTVWSSVVNDQQSATDDLLLFNGDISYARGWPYTWEVFHDQTAPFMRHIPAVYSYGNHEFDFSGNPWPSARGQDSGGEAGIVASRRFNMANKSIPISLVSFGPVVVITLSSEHDPVAQAAALQDEIKKINRHLQPWVIVQLHRPLYSSGHIDGTSATLRDTLSPVLEDPANAIDLVLTGHVHYYERTCAIRSGKCVAKGENAPVYIIDGSAGAEFISPDSSPSSPLTEYKDFLKWGYSRILVNSTVLTWNHIHTSKPGVPVDSVTLSKI